MPKTKITVNKGRKCPFCPYRFMKDEELSKHIGECSKELLFCNFCDFNSTTSKNLRRHLKRQHDIGEETCGEVDSVLQKEGPSESCVSDAESWVTQDPGDLRAVLLGDISESESEDEVSKEKSGKELPCSDESKREEGRLYRKPTRPLPVFAPARVAPLIDNRPSNPAPEKQPCEHKECQTDPVYFTESVKIITKWVEEGRRIKKIEKKKLL
ncbi:B-cell lymphoma/leukemia 11B-like [Saccostrea echinata]|uniref:B-cell lymphoma/leukemia 11B-like n=1 Tax=Saccostrea echinata TaxID=191078 RepID=UPI002A83C466|nr:B-cell lymphoma/leukemia 11B-like [Saccostrea echinata]